MYGSKELLTLEEWRESGLLWLINRTVFHPRGYALALIYGEDDKALGEENEVCVGFQLLGDGSEVWNFIEDIDDMSFERVKKFFEEKQVVEDNSK